MTAVVNQKSKNAEGTMARYEKIALDIAYEIYNQEFRENEIIKGRSTLAGKYGVSPETIRRSMSLLEEMDVVEVIDKVGISVKSKGNAHRFIQEYQSKNKILEMREHIAQLVIERERYNRLILEEVDAIVEQSLTLRNIGIIYPLEVKVESGNYVVNKSIGEIRFWEYTGATIIGINRDGKLSLSPGPMFIFDVNDTILYVGNVVNMTGKVSQFIKHGPEIMKKDK